MSAIHNFNLKLQCCCFNIILWILLSSWQQLSQSADNVFLRASLNSHKSSAVTFKRVKTLITTLLFGKLLSIQLKEDERSHTCSAYLRQMFTSEVKNGVDSIASPWKPRQAGPQSHPSPSSLRVSFWQDPENLKYEIWKLEQQDLKPTGLCLPSPPVQLTPPTTQPPPRTGSVHECRVCVCVWGSWRLAGGQGCWLSQWSLL